MMRSPIQLGIRMIILLGGSFSQVMSLRFFNKKLEFRHCKDHNTAVLHRGLSKNKAKTRIKLAKEVSCHIVRTLLEDAVLKSATLKEGETEEVLESLYHEKKKTKSLERSLLALQRDNSLLQSEVDKLREQALEQSSIARTEPRLKEAEEEINALHDQQKILKTLLKEAQEAKEASEALSFRHREESILLKEKLLQLGPLEKELAALQIDVQKNNELQSQLSEQKRELLSLQEAHRTVKQSMEESREHSHQLERVIQFLRERGEESQLEKKHLESELQQAQETMERVKSDLISAQAEWRDLSDHYAILQKSKNDACEELKAIQEQFGSLKGQIIESRAALEEKERALSEAASKIETLESKRELLEEKLGKTKEIEIELNETRVNKDEALKRLEIFERELLIQTEQAQLLKKQLRALKEQYEDTQEQLHRESRSHATTKNKFDALQQEKEDLVSREEKQQKTIHDLKASLAANESAAQVQIAELTARSEKLARQLQEQAEMLQDKEEIELELSKYKKLLIESDLSLAEEKKCSVDRELANQKLKQTLDNLKLEHEEALSKQASAADELNTVKAAKEEALIKLHGMEIESQRLREQFMESTGLIDLANRNGKLKEEQLQELKNELSKSTEERESLSAALQAAQQSMKGLEERHAQLAGEAEKTREELKEAKLQLEQLLKEKEQWQKQCEEASNNREQLQKQHREINDKLNRMQQEAQMRINELETATRNKGQLERQVEEIGVKAQKLSRDLENFERENNVKVKEKQALEVEVARLKKKGEEYESRVQIAQQHLAKKVKETTILSEDIEKKNHQINDLKAILANTQSQFSEARNTLDSNIKEKKELQEKLHETTHSLETQTRQWEEKCAQMYQQWQETEKKNSELKIQKNKLEQLQSLIRNLTGALAENDSPSEAKPEAKLEPLYKVEKAHKKEEEAKSEDPPIEAQSPPPLIQKVAEEDKEEEAEEEQKPDAYQNLFDIKKHQSKFKQNLFDE